MQNKLINILRIFFILILLVLGLLTAFRPAGTETNILKALFSDSENVLVDLSTRFSSKINVIVESSSSEKSEEISKTFYILIVPVPLRNVKNFLRFGGRFFVKREERVVQTERLYDII